MDNLKTIPKRYIGLDVHKHYLIAIGVDADLNQVYGPKRVELCHLEQWMEKTLNQEDAVVLEMTTNTWQLYDELSPHVQSVTVVHPPHVALITRSQVMNDKIAASILARLLAKGLLLYLGATGRSSGATSLDRPEVQNDPSGHPGQKPTAFHPATSPYGPSPDGDPFIQDKRSWWLSLPISNLEKVNLQSDLNTLTFAQKQVEEIVVSLTNLAAKDEHVTHLVHLPGIGIITALTILAAIGDIHSFEDAKHLVGYAGMGARVHDSGMTTRTGRITKAGRKDLRSAMVEAAQVAANSHPFWKQELKRLEPRLGRNKTIVAIARKLLVTVWYILAENATDCHA